MKGHLTAIAVITLCVGIYIVFSASFLVAAAVVPLGRYVAVSLAIIPALVVVISLKAAAGCRIGIRMAALGKHQENRGVTGIHALWFSANWHAPILASLGHAVLMYWCLMWMVTSPIIFLRAIELSDRRSRKAVLLAGLASGLPIAWSLISKCTGFNGRITWANTSALLMADALFLLWMAWRSGHNVVGERAPACGPG
jgi:hypothetical protein